MLILVHFPLSWPPPEFVRNWPKRVSLFRSLGVMRSSHHHSWPCSWEVWWERHPRKTEVCIYWHIWKDHVWKKKWNMFYLQHFFSFQIHLGEKRFQILSTFVKQLYLTTVGRWFLQHLERIAKSLPSSQLPQLARNRTPRLPLGEIHLQPHS